MGMSSSKTKTSSSSTPLDQYAPFITQGLNQANSVFQQNQPTLQGMSQQAQDAFASMAPTAFSASPAVTTAQNNATAIGSGAFYGTNPGAGTYQSIQGATNPGLGVLSGIATGSANPYTDAIAKQGEDAATRAANARFAAGGMGEGMSTPYMDVLTKNVANAGDQIRYQGYNDNANRQLQAGTALGSLFNSDAQTKLGAATAADSAQSNQIAQMLQSMGLIPALETARYAGVDPALNTLGAAASIPYTGVNAYNNAVNGLTAKYGNQTGTTTSSQGLGSVLGGIAGAGLAGWASGGLKGI